MRKGCFLCIGFCPHFLRSSDNLLTGRIPEALFGGCFSPPDSSSCSLSSALFYLFLQQNYLSGSIPSSIGGARGDTLFCLFLACGLCLTCCAGCHVSCCAALRQLFLFDNYLTGPLPPSSRNLTLLSTILLQRNLLSGQPGLPFSFAPPPRDSTASATSKSISGGIGLFNRSSFLNLQVVDIGDNRFSGSLPVEFFRLPRLRRVLGS